ncbi:MAG: large subunit ribosomal protein L10 [Parcubacteria group bacterium Licking1014_17]|nr:MAG: large subunit ribosomal protein L10 [Parcubacteria group bacterium Licking1014_17]
MKTRDQKIKGLKDINDRLSKSKIAIITSFARAGEKGLSVSEMNTLRGVLRAAGADYLVQKKTLMNRAFKNNKLEMDILSLTDSLGLVFGYEDEASAAKSVYLFSKKISALKLLGAFVDKRFIPAGELIEIAKLPNREAMIGRTVGMIKYPLSGLVNALQGVIRNLAVVLHQIASKKQ